MASSRHNYKGLAVLDLPVHQHHVEQAVSASTAHALHVLCASRLATGDDRKTHTRSSYHAAEIVVVSVVIPTSA